MYVYIVCICRVTFTVLLLQNNNNHIIEHMHGSLSLGSIELKVFFNLACPCSCRMLPATFNEKAEKQREGVQGFAPCTNCLRADFLLRRNYITRL